MYYNFQKDKEEGNIKIFGLDFCKTFWGDKAEEISMGYLTSNVCIKLGFFVDL